MEFAKPRIIVFDNQKKLSHKFISALEDRGEKIELTCVDSIKQLKSAFSDQVFDLLFHFTDKDTQKYNKSFDQIKSENPTLLICSVGNVEKFPETGHDFYISKLELKTDEIIDCSIDNILNIVSRDKTQNELSAMLLHDLRSPTQSIIGYLELLEKGVFGEINDGQRQILRSALNLSDTLIDLLEELSKVFQFERKEFQPLKTEIPLKEFIDETLRSLWVQADKKNIKFVPSVSQNLPNIYADRNALLRVVINLLTNAINYCPENGTVRIFVQPGESHAKTDMIHFRINDSGPGIPSEDLDFLFDKYFRVERHRQKSKGYGLGLYLSKLIIEAHEGQIGAYNNREGGSTFYFNLPVK